MPNGHREPYRFQFPDIGDPDTVALRLPSPLHTSDSEETWDNKIRCIAFDEVAHKVLFRWKFLVWRNKRRTRNLVSLGEWIIKSRVLQKWGCRGFGVNLR